MSDALSPVETRRGNGPPLPATQHPAIFMPDRFASDEAEVGLGDAPRRSGLARLARPLAYAASALVTIGLAVAGYFMLVPASRAFLPAGGPVATRVVTLDIIDSRADTVTLAMDAFDLRAGMFERRQMSCPDLGRGLVQVENAWIAYSLARREGPTMLDGGRTTRDSALFAGVKRVERRFEHSGCARP